MFLRLQKHWFIILAIMIQPSVLKIIAVLAHPDDAELTCFGTLLKYVAQGHEVKVIIACTGERGISIPERKHSTQRLEQSLRYQESLRAFSATGIEVETLAYEDGSLAFNCDLISAIETKLRTSQPDILLTHFVCANGNDHQDHYVLGQTCVNAALRCKSLKKLLHAEPLQPVKCDFMPNYFVNITDYFERKIQALSEHTSQQGRAYLTREFHLTRSRNNALAAATEFHTQGLLFESFYCRQWVDL